MVNQEAEQFGVVEDSISPQVFNVAVQQYNAGNQSCERVCVRSSGASAGAIAGANAVNVANAAGIGIHTVNVSWNNW